MTDYDERFITLEEAERLAHLTGEYDGREVTFSNDGAEWAEHWLPTVEYPTPALARVAVHRSTMKLPTVVVVSWSEYYPDDAQRAATWDKLKTVLLAKVGVVSALRSAFRDVIGGRHEPAEFDQAATAQAIPQQWLIEAETTIAEDGVRALRAVAVAGKFMSDEVDRVLKIRLVDIENGTAVATPPIEVKLDMPKPKPGPRAKISA
jgi:hypothetical protein